MVGDGGEGESSYLHRSKECKRAEYQGITKPQGLLEICPIIARIPYSQTYPEQCPLKLFGAVLHLLDVIETSCMEVPIEVRLFILNTKKSCR